MFLKRVFKIFKYLVISLTILFVLVLAGVNLPFSQRIITEKVNEFLGDRNIPAKIGRIKLLVTGKIGLDNVQIIKETGDTIVSSSQIKMSARIVPLLFKRVIVKSVTVSNTVFKVMTDPHTGDPDIVTLFTGGSEPQKKPVNKKETGKKWDIKVNSVSLKNIRFIYNDPFNGIEINQSVGKFFIRFDEFSLIGHVINAEAVELQEVHGGVSLRHSSGKAKTGNKSSSPGWRFQIKRSFIKDIQFTLHLPDQNQRFEFSLGKGDISESVIDLADNNISVTSAQMDEPGFFLFSTPVRSGSETEPKKIASTDFPGSLKISGNDFKINDGFFMTDNYSPKSSQDDKSYPFQITGLNTTIKDVRLSSKESRFDVNRLSFELKNGLKLARGEIAFSSDSTLKSRLEANLRTAESKLSLEIEAENDLASLYKSWESAQFSLNVHDTEVSAGDILCFLRKRGEKSLLDAKKNLSIGIKLKAVGDADMFNIGNLELSASSGISLSVSGQVDNIVKPDSSSYSVKFNAGPITRSGLIELMRLAGSSVKLPDFEPVTIEGTITGRLMAPDFMLNMQSKSGNIAIDGSISLRDKNYNLNMAYSSLELGKLLSISDFDQISGKLEFSGKEFIPERMTIIASVAIDTARYKGYNYHGIYSEVEVDHGLYNFRLNSSDPLFECNLTGTVDHKKSLNKGQLSGTFNLDAGKLNLFRDLSIRGALDGNINQNTEGLSASLSIKNLVLSTGDGTEDLQNLSLSFLSSRTNIKVKVESDFLKAAFDIAGTSDDLQRILKGGRLRIATIMDSSAQNRIPYISALPETSVSIESTYDPIIGLILNDTIFSYHKIKADIIKDTAGFVRADVLIDRFNFGDGSGFATSIQIGTLPDRSIIRLSADSLKYGKLMLTGMQTDISTAGDSATYRFKADDKDNRPLYDISGVAIRGENLVKLRSTQKQWILNGFNWNVSPGDFLVLDPARKDFRTDLHWSNDQRTIDIYGTKSDKLSLELKKVGISTLLIPVIKVNGFDGELTGKMEYQGNGKTNLGIQMDIIKMKMSEIEFGNMNITGYYLSDTTGIVDSDFKVVMNDTSWLNLSFKNGKDDVRKNFKTDFSGFPLSLFESFISKYISGLKGEVSGNLALTPGNGKPMLNGEVTVSNMGLRVIPLNALFYIPDDAIRIENSTLVFSQFTVLDSLRKRLILNGIIDLNDPADIRADMNVTSELLQVMNTTEKDNQAFNGSVFVNSKLRISGSIQKPAIQGNIVLAEGTVINYSYKEDLSVSETQKLITFASLSQDQDSGTIKQTYVNPISKSPDIEASIEIDPRSLFNFQISRGFDIGVSIRGGGFLTYSLMPNREMDLTGTYEINEGSSELKIPGWPRKDFIITPGSYLKWDGKVDDPELQVETTSKVRGSYLNPVDGKTREVNFLVYMKLAGTLTQLEIIFDVRSEDQYITSVFNSLSADERMRQAINLLIFGSIQLPNLSSSSDYMTQQINQFWESQLNQITKSAIKKVDVSIGVDTYTGAAQGGGEQTYTSLSYQVKKDMFRDRGSVLVSGHMNDNSPASQQSNSVIENFIFEYALDSNRTKYLKIYRQQNYEDLLEGEVIKSGIGFIYRKNYDRISDIWRRQKKPKK